jgi:hypothetical protein
MDQKCSHDSIDKNCTKNFSRENSMKVDTWKTEEVDGQH